MKYLKTIIQSSLLAIMFGTLSVSTSFALLSDNFHNNINVVSGVVDLNHNLKISGASSLNEEDINTYSDNLADFFNGGHAEIIYANNNPTKVRISNFTPGDKLNLVSIPSNNSNVKIKKRLKIAVEGELADQISVRATNLATNQNLAVTGEKSAVSKWEIENRTGVLDTYSFEILYNDYEEDKIYSDLNSNSFSFGQEANISIAYEAVQANSKLDSFLEEVNSYLTTKEVLDGSRNLTMFDAVQDLKQFTEEDVYETFKNYVWSQKTDQLFLESEITTNKNEYFKMYSSMPEEQTFSIYALPEWTQKTISGLKVGFDVGNNDIEEIDYDRANEESSIEAVIRTNNTVLNIDGYVDESRTNGDIIYHYGNAALVNIYKCADGSYHESGGVGELYAFEGHVVFEEKSIIGLVTTYNEDSTQSNKSSFTLNSGAVIGNLLINGQNSTSKLISVIANKGSKTINLKVKNESNISLIYKTGSEILHTNTIDKINEAKCVVISGINALEGDLSTSGWTSNIENTDLISKEGSGIQIDKNSGAFKYSALEDGNQIIKTVEFKGSSGVKYVDGVTDSLAVFSHVMTNTNKVLNRVGNKNSIKLRHLFKLEGDIEPSDIKFSLENITGNVTTVFTLNENEWPESDIKFNGEGVVKVNLQDGDIGEKCELFLEVLEAKNIYTNSDPSATDEDVILLDDVLYNGGVMNVTNGHYIYGNNHKLRITSDRTSKNVQEAFMKLNNGHLDSLIFDAPKFNKSIMYAAQLKDSSGTYVASFNTYNGILTEGESTISNCIISGARTGVYINGGNTVIKDSIISGGAVANIEGKSNVNCITLNNLITIQSADNDSGALGLGFFEIADSTTKQTSKIIIEGYLHQYNWASENDKDKVPSGAQYLISSVFNKTDFIHTIDDVECVNTGFVFMDENLGTPIINITDNRSEEEKAKYHYDSTTLSSASIYSYKNDTGYSLEKNYQYENFIDKYSLSSPSITYNEQSSEVKWALETRDGYQDKVSNIEIELEPSVKSYNFDFNYFEIKKYNNSLTFDVYESNKYIENKIVNLTTAGVYIYELRFSDNLIFNNNGERIEGLTIEYTHFVILTLKKKAIVPPTRLTSDEDLKFNSNEILYLTSGGDRSFGIPAFNNVDIQYYNEGEIKTINLSTCMSFSGDIKGKVPENKTYFNYESEEGWKLKINANYETKTGFKAGPFIAKKSSGDNLYKLYFAPQTTDGFNSNKTTTRNVQLDYDFTDPNQNKLDTFSIKATLSYDEYKNNKYGYQKFSDDGDISSSSSSGGGCLASGTMVNVDAANYISVEKIGSESNLLSFDHESGTNKESKVLFNDNESEDLYNVVHLIFNNGKEIKVVSEHGFFDLELNRYVYIDEYNYYEFIGHSFYSINGKGVKLVNAFVKNECTELYSPVTFKTLNYYVEDILSMPGGIKGLFNIFEYDENLKYDEEKMARDIEQYGILDYTYFENSIPYEIYEAFNGKYLGVALGKGLLTEEELHTYIRRYSKYWIQ